jgi:hypothetical protein
MVDPDRPAARDVLEVFAVVGAAVRLGELVRYAYRPQAEVARAVDELIHAGVVARVEGGRNPIYEIADARVGETVYGQLNETRRLALHRHVGRNLLSSGRLGEAAAHFALSASPGDREATVVLLDALAEAEQRDAHVEAAWILADLMRLAPSEELADLPV